MLNLAERHNSGISVWLDWRKSDGLIEIRVEDLRTLEVFTLYPPRSLAFDVFNHPFAYRERFGSDLASGKLDDATVLHA